MGTYTFHKISTQSNKDISFKYEKVITTTSVTYTPFRGTRNVVRPTGGNGNKKPLKRGSLRNQVSVDKLINLSTVPNYKASLPLILISAKSRQSPIVSPHSRDYPCS